MQVDGANVDTDVDTIHYFDTSPESFPWRDPIPHQIETRRGLLSDLLFFDILLSSGGISDPTSLYPPPDASSLRNLLQEIENSNYDALKKDCLVYFLLKWHQDGREVKFADERCIPPQFAALSDAYWYLDTGFNIETAVSIFSDARLNRDYASKILDVISLLEDSAPLILRYVRASKPMLTGPHDIDKYTMAMAEISFAEAWQFQKTFADDSETRLRLLRKILYWCLTPKPRSQPLKQLLAFPLSAFEQSLLYSYALNPPVNLPAASIPVIQDLVCVRLIHSGQYATAIKLDRQFTTKDSRVTETSQKLAQNRRHLMGEIMATMPTVERQLLETELGQFSQSKEAPSLGPILADSWVNMSNGAINSMTMSWEHAWPNATSMLPRSTAFVSGPPISQRAGAPRFGVSAFPRSTLEVSHPLSTAPSPFPPHATNHPPMPPLSVSISTPVDPSGVSSKQGYKFIVSHPTELQSRFSSANHAPNAFYDPPPTSGVKRRFEQAETLLDASSLSDHEQVPMDDLDVEMRSENNHAVVTTEEVYKENEQPSQLLYSVFGASSINGSKPSTSKIDGKTKVPPGAFMPDSEDEQEVEPIANGRFSISVSPPPSRIHSPPQARLSQSHAVNGDGKIQLPQSIPGTLFSGDEEEDDVIAPLPTPRRQQRKTRTGASKKKVAEEDKEDSPEKPIRRSSRLSTASSRSISPEPRSPQKSRVRKSTRPFGTVPSSARSGIRKK